ncbi:hypothetical protein [Heliophilum fasciatum]|uniref:Uncharacterized protein n=1 Tax=Heliophilum fasciatum TaxID=35700 RepID=A0A4R2RWM4_9FIRM|nr:hypothetical protein [Heliophilum fasciatum]MCW2276757.1 hypothetical protein [Heliophilum fasciatum]TCP68862.1 hypothetical protein EDD73_10123 [Heliophilum fasciatum]
MPLINLCCSSNCPTVWVDSDDDRVMLTDDYGGRTEHTKAELRAFIDQQGQSVASQLRIDDQHGGTVQLTDAEFRKLARLFLEYEQK